MPSSRKRSKGKDGNAPAGEQPTLRALVQKRLLKDVFQLTSEKWPGWKILVVDERSMRVISSTVGMYDIMERKVTLVESLDKKRAPFPDMGAIYLIDPCRESVEKLIADYSSDKVLYGDAVFLYFLGHLPDELFNLIKDCKPLLKRVKALTEVNVDFLAKEDRAFVLDMRDSFSGLYQRSNSSSIEVKIADRLVTVCATLNEYPHIRYRHSSALCNSLASVFHIKMDKFVAQNPNWWYHGGPQKNQPVGSERGTLLLLDRSEDCLSPLMHDFHYQCIVRDLLKMEEDKITYQTESATEPGKTEDKDVLLNEKDKIWVELRGNHFAQVIEILSSRIREITSSSTSAALEGGPGQGSMSLSQMASAIKAFPEYKEMMSKLSMHMTLAHQCMGMFTKLGLLNVSSIEQTLATGKDDEGNTPKFKDMLDDIEETVKNMANPIDKIRMILICSITQGGLSASDKRRLVTAAELNEDELKAVENLESLGQAALSGTPKQKQQQQQGFVSLLTGGGGGSNVGSNDDEEEYVGCRYNPPLKEILNNWVNESLSLDDYPSVMPMPETGASRGGKKKAHKSARASTVNAITSARKNTGPSNKWSKSGASNDTGGAATFFSGARCIVFVVGGMTYSELRVTREVMRKEQKEVISGSTAFVSPKEFVEDLTTLGQSD